MYKTFIFSMLCIASLLTAADNETAKAQIDKRLQDFIEAINKDKKEVLATFWTQDAQIVKPTTGEVISGKDNILKYLQQREQEIQSRQLQFNVKPIAIQFPASNKAVVEGILEISDKQGLIQRNARKLELVNQNGQWFIKNIREIEVAPAPPIYDHLKDLEWMIGDWKDQDQDVDITFNAKWDKFKNFIIQHFTMQVYGLEAFEGIQIIGWDPVQENIRSWVYDSDGGFGEGQWTKKGNDWQVAMQYTLSDGNKGSSTNIYSDITPTSYKYSSVDRSIEGEKLDNITPVNVVKEKQS